MLNISREMVKRGHEVHVFTAARYGGRTAPETETIDGISVHRLLLSLDWSYRMKVWKGLQESLLAQDFDVIHTYDYAQPHSAVAIRAGEISRTGTVLTVFDIHSMIPRTWYRRLPMKMIERYMARRTLPGADRILVRAPNLVDPLLGLGGRAEKIQVTPSGVRDESLGIFDGKGFRSRHGLDGAPVILYMGRLNPLKGPQYLIESAPEILRGFPQAQFVFVGPDQGGFTRRLEARAAKLGIDSHVHFLGPIYEFDEKMAAYASCDVFALPTSYEGTSQAIFEAMAQARPVVATAVGGVPFQLTDGAEGRLVKYGDVGAFTGALQQVLGDSDASHQMGSRGREKVESRRYSVLSEGLEEVYRQVVRNN